MFKEKEVGIKKSSEEKMKENLKKLHAQRLFWILSKNFGHFILLVVSKKLT